jgi:hypothetical protein
MLSEARKKVLLDLFGVPIIVIPVVGGLACLMLSWAVGGSALLSLLGGIGLIIAGCGFASRIAKAPQMISKQKQYEHEEKAKAQRRELDKLDTCLKKDRDPRTQTCLREIRDIYETLQEDIREGQISPNAYSILSTVEGLFHACVDQLKQTYDLWEASRNLRGKHRKKLETQRNELVGEVEATVCHLADSVQQFHVLRTSKGRQDLSKLRKQLDDQIDVARRAERKRRSIYQEDQDFESFLSEE